MVLAGALGLSRQTFAREVRVAFALLVLEGLGSIAFHATLRFELQMLDELPMLYLVTWLVWLLRSEEHTSELQSLAYLVCRLLLEKKKQSISELLRPPQDTSIAHDARRTGHEFGLEYVRDDLQSPRTEPASTTSPYMPPSHYNNAWTD